MPLTDAERAYLSAPSDAVLQGDHQRFEKSPALKEKIGRFTIICLILNRTIGSGIFNSSHRVLAGAGCVGGFFILWFLAVIIQICGVYVWLECGLSLPQRTVEGEDIPRGVPRSGGEKNFLEAIFSGTRSNTKLRTTCCFSIMFITLYNLSGNAIACAIEIMIASGLYSITDAAPPDQKSVVGIAIGVLSLSIIFHVCSRRGGILLNNAFAVVKVLLLLAIVCLGIAKAAGAFKVTNIDERIALDNFTKDVWRPKRRDVSSWSNSLLLCMYSLSGYKQPFYVLAETRSPRRDFPKCTVIATAFAGILFILVNIAYLLVVPKSEVLDSNNNNDLANLFFHYLFQDHKIAARAMAALVAFSIFGNIFVMTFTAARVKQEIAKEGILPWSLTFASSHATPWGLWKRWKHRASAAQPGDLEQSPQAAFFIHWLSSVMLIIVTLPIKDPRTAYYVLASIYTYSITLLLGFWVSIGLLWIKLGKGNLDWKTRRRYRPWLSPVHVIIYTFATFFIMVAALIPPSAGSPYSEQVTHLKWFIVPVIGLSAPLWGYVWYLGILLTQRVTNRDLVVKRTPWVDHDEKDPLEYVQTAEIVDHRWVPRMEQGTSVFNFNWGKIWKRKSGNVKISERERFEDHTEGKDNAEINQVQVPRGRAAGDSHPLANGGWRQYAFDSDTDSISR